MLLLVVALVPAARAGRFVEQRLTWTPNVLAVEKLEPSGTRTPLITESPWGADTLVSGARAVNEHHVYDIESAAGSQLGIGDYDLEAGVAHRVPFADPIWSSTLEFDPVTGLLLTVKDLGIPSPPSDFCGTDQLLSIDPASGELTPIGAPFGICFAGVTTFDPVGERIFLLHAIQVSGPSGSIEEAEIRALDPQTGVLLQSWAVPEDGCMPCRHADYDPVRDRVLLVYWNCVDPALVRALDLATGDVTDVATIRDQVGTPGFGALDPDGRRLMIAAEASTWTIDVDSGAILEEVPAVLYPNWIAWDGDATGHRSRWGRPRLPRPPVPPRSGVPPFFPGGRDR